MSGYTVEAVTDHGTVAVLHGRDDWGWRVDIAAEPRMARDVEAAIAAGETPRVDAEPWQIVARWPDDAD